MNPIIYYNSTQPAVSRAVSSITHTEYYALTRTYNVFDLLG